MFDFTRKPTTILGSEVVVGDIIAPWGGRIARVNSIKPYNGVLWYLWQGKARIAEFIEVAGCPTNMKFKARGMTLEPDALIEVYR